MNGIRRALGAWPIVLALGCAGGGQSELAVPAPVLENDRVRATMAAALTADAVGERGDSLYLAGATVIADGLTQGGPPRFAGVQPGGTVAISGTTMEITPYFAWGVVDYRYTLPGRPAVFGRVTFVLERAGGSWRIKHAHSSSLPAGRPR